MQMQRFFLLFKNSPEANRLQCLHHTARPPRLPHLLPPATFWPVSPGYRWPPKSHVTHVTWRHATATLSQVEVHAQNTAATEQYR